MSEVGVDKSGLLVRGGDEVRRFQAAQNCRKMNSCVRCRILQEWDCHIAALAAQFLEGPLRRVFFLGHENSFGRYAGQARIGRPTASLPEYFRHSKRYTTFKCFCRVMQLSPQRGDRESPAANLSGGKVEFF